MINQTKQTQQTRPTTTGVVAVERVHSGASAFVFTVSNAISHRPAICPINPMNDGTDLTPALGTRAWSPPV